MIYDNEFHCVDGHTFRANAKIRARCPECGKSAKRTFSKEPTSNGAGGNESPELLPAPTPIIEDKQVRLIRRGKPKLTIMAAKRTTPPKGPDGKFLPAKKTAKKPVAKKPVSNKPVSNRASGTAANNLVKRRTIAPGKKATPVVRRPPQKTAVARHIVQGGKKSYAEDMMERFGYGRRG